METQDAAKVFWQRAAMPATWMTGRRGELQYLMPELMTFGLQDLVPVRHRTYSDLLAVRDLAEDDVMGPRQGKEPCHSCWSVWCTCRASTRMMKSKAGTVEFKPSLREHLDMPGDDTEYIKLMAIDQENNEIHF